MAELCIMLTESAYYIAAYLRIVMPGEILQNASSQCFAHTNNENVDARALCARPQPRTRTLLDKWGNHTWSLTSA
jgi:hypothetical protein